MRAALLSSLLVMACAPGPAPLETVGLAPAFDVIDGGWQVRVLSPTARMGLDVDAGCLKASPEVLPPDTVLPALAMNADWVVVDAQLSCVARGDVEEMRRPVEVPAAAHAATVQRNTGKTTFGPDGCLASLGGLDGGTRIDARAWAHDGQYRGEVVIDSELSMATLRHVDVDDVSWPWHSGVMLIRVVDAGYVFGAGVVIGPKAILTVRHVGSDAFTCYGREAHAGPAWYGGRFVCDDVERVENHPVIDAAVIVLKNPTPPPYAKVRATAVEPQQPIYSSQWSSQTWTQLADSTVEFLSNTNALCQSWPAASTFVLRDMILQGGDSGGPSYSGDELVGLVHGQECSVATPRHVMIHVPFLKDFIAPYQ